VTERSQARAVPLSTIAREWTRIGLTGFGGPPAHIALFRRLVVERRGWIDERELEDAIAACNLLPGPASTQLAIFCARRLGGPLGAVVGGLGFILPAVILVLVLSALFLAHAPPTWVRGAGAGAGAAVAAVAVQAAVNLLGPSLKRAGRAGPRRLRWGCYVALGIAAAALLGPYLVLVLLACGAFELALTVRLADGLSVWSFPVVASTGIGGAGALAWVAFKVGALSYGGGFVIVPLMRTDAVHTYHWMTSAHFLSAVALGQVTPGPVVATVAAIGYAAHGVGGGALAAAIAFLPSFLIVLVGGRHFEQLRTNSRAQAFLDGAGPAAIGAILGSAITLTRALTHPWQYAVLAAALILLLPLRRGVVLTLLSAAAIGVIIALAAGTVSP
jgi:chromate transporter